MEKFILKPPFLDAEMTYSPTETLERGSPACVIATNTIHTFIMSVKNTWESGRESHAPVSHCMIVPGNRHGAASPLHHEHQCRSLEACIKQQMEEKQNVLVDVCIFSVSACLPMWLKSTQVVKSNNRPKSTLQRSGHLYGHCAYVTL